LVVKKLFSGELIEGALGLGVAMAEVIPAGQKSLVRSLVERSLVAGKSESKEPMEQVRQRSLRA